MKKQPPQIINCKNCKKPFRAWVSSKRVFCNRKCQVDEFSPSFKKGRYIDGYGYVVVYKPRHVNARKDGYILEHRYVMSIHLRRTLSRDEHVHHINGIKDDNRVENLGLMSRSDHIGHHRKGKMPTNPFPKGHKNEYRWQRTRRRVSISL